MNSNIDTDTLLILGNGFDLHCGLNTSYKNFMNYINQVPSTVCTYTSTSLEDNVYYINDYLHKFLVSISCIYKHKNNYNYNDYTSIKGMISPLFKRNFHQKNILADYNFWQSYFNLLHDVKLSERKHNSTIKFNKFIYLENWCDIESQIAWFFNQYSSFLDKYVSCYKEYYHHNLMESRNQRQRNKQRAIFSFHVMVHDKFLQDNKKWTNHTNAFMIPLVIMILRKSNFHPLKDNLYDFLFNELYDFENKFEDFLQNVNHVNYVRDYTKRGKPTKFSQLKNITTRELTGGKSYNLVTFNYTNDKANNCNNCVNVHSNIFNGHPIFGIDATNNFNKEYYRFTKTYRIMKLANKSNNHILDLTNDNNVKNIVFYGQSLAPADYMYFQAMFNHYQIYSNTKVQLTFCYNSSVSQNESRNQFTRIYRLMNKYGNQCEHSDLLHKMLLEGRLYIRDLDDK